MIDRVFLMRLRSIVIDLLNTIDDSLGLPRTIPDKSERRRIHKLLIDTVTKV